MKEFNSTKLEKQNINGGKQFTNGQVLSADDLNPIIEGILYNNENCSDEIVVDTELNENSENPVQNKVIAKEIKELKEKTPETTGTTVTVNGEAVETFDADTKVDKFTNKGAKRVYGTKRSDGSQIMIQVVDIPNLPIMVENIPQYLDKNSPSKPGENALLDENAVLLTNEPNQPYQCANKKYVDDIANTKATLIPEESGNSWSKYVIGVNGLGEQVQVKIAGGITQMTSPNLPQYWYAPSYTSPSIPTGVLITGTPTLPPMCANKQYVDDAVANAGGGKLYRHNIWLKCKGYDVYNGETEREYDLTFSFSSPRSTMYSPQGDSPETMQSLRQLFAFVGLTVARIGGSAEMLANGTINFSNVWDGPNGEVEDVIAYEYNKNSDYSETKFYILKGIVSYIPVEIPN